MEKIHLSRGTVIEVNDNGETIVMQTDDQQFVERFYGLTERIGAIQKKLNEDAIKSMNEHEQLKILISETKGLMQEMDSLFGDGSCRKIFGDIVPHPYLIADFFEQLKPIVKRHVDARQKKLAEKYDNKRKGSRNRYRSKEELIQAAMGK